MNYSLQRVPKEIVTADQLGFGFDDSEDQPDSERVASHHSSAQESEAEDSVNQLSPMRTRSNRDRKSLVASN